MSQSIQPNYYQWSLDDIDSAHLDLFQRFSSLSLNDFLEPLSYYHCQRFQTSSSTYDRLIHGNFLYPYQHFGTSQMSRPHPLRCSIPWEERFRLMPVRSSSMIGRRAHLPLDLFLPRKTEENCSKLKN